MRVSRVCVPLPGSDRVWPLQELRLFRSHRIRHPSVAPAAVIGRLSGQPMFRRPTPAAPARPSAFSRASLAIRACSRRTRRAQKQQAPIAAIVTCSTSTSPAPSEPSETEVEEEESGDTIFFEIHSDQPLPFEVDAADEAELHEADPDPLLATPSVGLSTAQMDERLARAADLARRAAAYRSPRLAVTESRHGLAHRCPYCHAALSSAVLCEVCVARTLGWSAPLHGMDCSAEWRAALRGLCEAPAVASLARVLTEMGVQGDGSCWSYALLCHFGWAPHATRRGVPWRGPYRITRADQLSDRMMRAALLEWMRANGGAARFHGDERSLEQIGSQLPGYSKRADGRSFVLGRAGGDTEFVAAADILGCAILAISSAGDGGDEAGRLFEPGRFLRGGAWQRGRWTDVPLSVALRQCVERDRQECHFVAHLAAANRSRCRRGRRCRCRCRRGPRRGR